MESNTQEFKLCSKSKHSPRWKRHGLWPQWNIAPVEKAFWLQWNISSRFIAPIEKTWFYERLFFEVLIVMVKEYSIKDTMSIKISPTASTGLRYQKKIWYRVCFLLKMTGVRKQFYFKQFTEAFFKTQSNIKPLKSVKIFWHHRRCSKYASGSSVIIFQVIFRNYQDSYF